MSVRKIALWGILLGFSVMGANLKILGSIAFDSFPAFLGALLLGPVAGAFLGAFGHLVSSFMAGFPASLPVHLIIAVLMAMACYLYAWSFKKFEVSCGINKAFIIASSLAYLVSVILDFVVLYPVLQALVWVLFWPVTLATIANLLLSCFVYRALNR